MLAVIHVVMLYVVQYVLNRQIMHKVWKAIRAGLIYKVEEFSHTDVDKDGLVAGKPNVKDYQAISENLEEVKL